MRYLLPLLIVATACAQEVLTLPIEKHTDNLRDGLFRELVASPTNTYKVIQMETNHVEVFSVLIRSEVVTNWVKFDPYVGYNYVFDSNWPQPWIYKDGFLDASKLADYTMTGTIVSNVIALVGWKGEVKPLVVESTPLGELTKRVTHESKKVETVSPVTWYGTNDWVITGSVINGVTNTRLRFVWTNSVGTDSIKYFK